MVNRRIFFKHAGAYAVGTWLLPACTSQGSKAHPSGNEATPSPTTTTTGQPLGPIGMQLYSVKDVIEGDLKGTLQKIAEVGYQEIESYPGTKGHYFGMEPKAFSTMLSDMGLTLVSSHFGSGTRDGQAESWHQATLLHDFDKLVEKAAQTGQPYLTCSSLAASLRKTPDDLKRMADLFNQAGETCQQAGMQFAYHNHNFEFEKVGDTMMYDFMLENTDPELVQWEMDMYWVVAGGQDPITYLKKYPNRFPLGHVKDMDKQDKTKNAIIGQGSIDYVKILEVAKDAGMKHFLVEQETFTGPSLDAMQEDYAYLSEIKV